MRQSQHGNSDDNMKLINDYEWRPITFQGEMFPPELMAITVVECLFEIEDEKTQRVAVENSHLLWLH